MATNFSNLKPIDIANNIELTNEYIIKRSDDYAKLLKEILDYTLKHEDYLMLISYNQPVYKVVYNTIKCRYYIYSNNTCNKIIDTRVNFVSLDQALVYILATWW